MNGDLVAGGVPTSVSVGEAPLDVAFALEFAADPSAGCTLLFVGTVRDHAPGKTGVTHLEYEAYAGVVEAKIAEVVSEAAAEWPVIRIVAHHRVGSLAVGEPAVVVAVSAAHRDAAFPAGRFLIDEIKARAPIWKKEYWDGKAEWVEGA